VCPFPFPKHTQVREAQLSQYNYILVVGEQEQREGNVNVRTRDNIVHGMHSIADLIRTLKEEKDSRSLTSKFETTAAGEATGSCV
jgi:threonyl-tRNA synthetase